MGHSVYITLLCVVAISYSYGCDINPPGTPWIPQSFTIKDTFRGTLWSVETRNIASIANVGATQNLNGGPYFNGRLEGSQFTFYTVDSNFDDYEENETLDNTSLNILFNCVGGTTRSLTFIIFITDTNNNKPRFIPTDELEFTLIPPLPPGFSITGCFNDITVRDIDLTTKRIDFEIFESPLFEISYDAASSTVPKEFKASLKTRTFIRSIPEPIEFRISATDVDETNDPPFTTYATVRIKSADDGFELPDEPIFTQAYYLATYTKENLVILEEKISLRQGYHEDVLFSLEQGTTQHFNIRRNGNDISLLVVTPLTEDFLVQRQILIVIKATRENTSGANAAIIIEVPEDEELKFEQPTYEGAIVDNVLQLSSLIVSQGNPVSAEIFGDYSGFFRHTLEDNKINLTMSPLDANIIEENTFLNLLVVASTNRTSVSTVVTLEIVKDDSVTPVFGRAVYEGSYNVAQGLSLEQIVLVQGYDDTVRLSLQGEHATYFELDRDGPSTNLKLNVSSLPAELFSEQNLLLYLRATKPRTVGATTAVSIALPTEIQLEFEQQYYRGIIEDNVLHLSELTLSKGYDNDEVFVTVVSAHATFFNADIEQNKITLSMSPLDDDTINQSSFLNLEIIATTNRSSAFTIVTLEIIKDDSVTPVFERAVYSGVYDTIHGLTLEEIVLIQGYDNSVRVSLQGEHSGFFEIDQQGPFINLTVSSLPSELFREHNLVFSIEATKPRTVGANAAITVALPAEIQLEFEQPNYRGIVKDNALELTELVLLQGYENDPVYVSINDDYAPYFEAEIEKNEITITMRGLNSDIIEENTFINLHVVAFTNRSSATTIVTLEIIKNDTTTPVFESNLYEGSYDPSDGLTLEGIFLVQGYDETVRVNLVGEHSSFFQLFQMGPYMVVNTSSLPADLLSMHNLLLSIEATKPRTVGANAAISITLPEARDMNFENEVYSGTIQGNLLQIENIIMSIGYTNDVVFELSGEYASYFNVTNVQNQISLNLREPLSDRVLEDNNFLLLTLSGSALNAVTATTTIAIDIIKEDITTPVFNQNIYYGSYTGPSSINIDTISLSQGFDSKVSFRLEGEHSQYFRINDSESSEVVLVLHSAIPEEVIFNEKVLLFSILAEKELTVGANAAVSINFPRELTEPSVLSFAKNIYIGSLQQNILSLEDVVLETGFATGTQFSLTGDFSSYFTLRDRDNILTISAENSLPTEIFGNKFITFEVEARRTRAVSVSTTIIIDIEQPELVVPPVFTEAYYRGIYTQENGLHFTDEISLSQGFDDTVTFELEGESSQWFNVTQDKETVYITTRANIPVEIVQENHNLLFTIVAQKPDAIDGRAAINIDLPKEISSDQILGFDRLSYLGSIEDNVVILSPIVLREGPTSGVTFTLHGQLASYFRVNPDGRTVTVTLPASIPVESIPSNRIIVLEMQASAPQAASAYATIVFHVVVDDDPLPGTADLVFGSTYYVGSYTSNAGLVFDTPISLAEGYDPDVVFTLEGDNSQWFRVPTPSSNSITLELSSPIPPAVVANNQKLIFVVRAQRPGGVAARATVVIALPDESTAEVILGFDQLSYLGSITNNAVNLSPIVLREGPTSGVTFTLHGQLASYFRVNPDGRTVTVTLPASIPVESIPSNRIIVLEMQASAPQAASAYATIVFQVVVDDDPLPGTADLVFGSTYYVGSYTSNAGLVFDTPISLAEGYDPDVVFTLEGDNSQWFRVPTPSSNSITLELSSPIPPAVVANNQKLIFVVRAQRPGGVATRATVVIALPDESTGEVILGFDQISYLGSITNNDVNLSPIVLREGPTSGVTFTLHGQLASYFRVNPDGRTVTVTLPASIPVESIPSNRIIVLEMQASALQAASAYATIVFQVVVDDDPLPGTADLVFGSTYYVGSYTSNAGLVFDTPISLAEGYDPDVVFTLEGDNSQWFRVPTPSSNSITLELSSPIPPAVVANNQKLIFVVRAQRPGGVAARATVVIALPDESTGEVILGFDQLSYLGSITNNAVNLSPIVLREGPTSGVTFTLHGQLASYFRVNPDGRTVTVTLPASIPVESIPSNRIIVLEMQASALQAASAYATIVFQVVVDDDPLPGTADLVFGSTYYVGSYTSNAGLVFDTPISLAEGFDPDVVFTLEGDNSQWFRVPTPSSNSITLELSSPIPPAVVANNQKLIFVVRAQRPGGVAARATVVIALPDESTGEVILGFDQLSYLGSITNNDVNLSPIVLREGPTSGVTFTLHGQLASYFRVNPDGRTVTVTLPASIPVESIPSNRIIVLEMQASAPQAASAYATIVFQVVVDDDPLPGTADLVFGSTYYVGSYTSNAGLVFDTPISLAEGFDPDVVFTLEGDNSQWFRVPTPSSNSITLELSSPIPPAVVANNQKLIFVVRAQRPGGVAARATVVIALPDESTGEVILGFDQLSYLGSITNNDVNLSPIVLREGPTSGVTFTLHGQLASYFRVNPDGRTVTVTLPASIPVESIPSNRIIVLEMQASAPQAASAYATIVFHVVVDDDPLPGTADLVFGSTYYVGSYTSNAGLVFDTPISLAEGYDPDVVFTLEGDNSQWFRVPTPSSNSITLELSSPIPPAVVANNQKLIFVVRAQRPGGVAARATVVIALPDESTGEVILGFDQISYLGSITNNAVNLSPIVLREGPTSGVTFTLHGQLASYFRVNPDGRTVTVTLPASIPVESIPSNRIIVLEMQASAPQAASAYATIVFQVVVDDDPLPGTADLVFGSTYYVGSYTSNAGLVFDTPISLAEGFDPDVVFTLEGDNSQWFRVPTPSSNSITLELSSPIPPAVVANNQKLIFVVRAQRPGGVAARATVVIALPDESTGEVILGFDQLSYLGSITNNAVNLSPIVLREGPTSGVTFTLHGQLASYFRVNPDGRTVTVTLPASIPVESIPSNRIIVLEMQASAPQAASAYATIVFQVVVDDDPLPGTADLVFGSTYYVGSYTSNAGLVFDTPISLAEGFDPDVVFTLEGDNSQWFRVPTPSSNSITLELSSPIPPAVVANNQKLIFVVRAQRPGGVAARATVVIALPDESTGEVILGFDQLSYLGSITNNAVNLSPIVLREGPTSGVTFTLHGQLASYFRVNPDGRTVTITLPASIPVESIPSNRIIVLEMQASAPQAASAYATIVFQVVVDDDPLPGTADLVFGSTYYVGSYTSNAGLVFDTPISLAEGFDPDVVFTLEGDNSQWFRVPTPSSNSITLELSSPIPPAVVANNQKLIFVVRAQRPGGVAARATVVIALPDDIRDSSVAFDKVLYVGIIQGSVVQHEAITVIGYDGTDINIVGTYASLFRAIPSDSGLVEVETIGPLTLPADTRHVILELRLAETGAVLILQFNAADEQPLPTVTFDRAPYVFSVKNRHTGLVGQVRATSDNGEAVTYLLNVENDHLRSRLTVSSEGELRLSAPADRGTYNFQVIATTVFTQAIGQTTIQLTVEEVIEGPTICGDDIVTDPLIIIDRDEEEEHRNLVTLNTSELPDCHYTITNKWPVDQKWLYVDETGLHTHAIDREDPSIAYMALSQVQVELNLVCDRDETRAKRSLDTRLDWLGPYNYGNKKWILTDSIPFNPRKSIVNLIVNDINDNTPIFDGNENEPIIVGYPISDLEETIMPRSLAELQATDADVGENAALLYWSDDPEIAVSPTTGFVHVRTDVQLQDNMTLTINATDRNGAGLTGSISLTVRLLDSENIAVITVRDAFLEDESRILGNLSNAIGYEVRPLRSVVVSMSPEEQATRKKRDTAATSGTSLEVYVYGLLQREPVAVERLSDDINSAAIAAVDIASILSLEDHLEGNEICVIPGRDTGLLAATIVLSILLFIFIVAAVVWFLLTRKKQENYDKFSDANSLASQNESFGQPSKPDTVAKPRLNIEELKRSEKRLQEMLNAPIEEVTIEATPSSSNKDTINSVTKIPLPDPLAPIVIQDKLKDASEDSDEEDEFGERKKARRKSVVTFNENVEKIIHVDDEPEEIADANYEIYKF